MIGNDNKKGFGFLKSTSKSNVQNIQFEICKTLSFKKLTKFLQHYLNPFYSLLFDLSIYFNFYQSKVTMLGKLFQRCTHLLYCSVLSLGGNVNTRPMSQPDMGSIFHIKKSTKYSVHRKLLYELSKFNAFNLQG